VKRPDHVIRARERAGACRPDRAGTARLPPLRNQRQRLISVSMRRRRLGMSVFHHPLRRRRMVRRLTFAGLALLALSAVLDRAGVFRYPGDDWRAFDQKTVLVTHVADGDTIVVTPTTGG